MTAKEKAKKIVNRYLDYIPFADNSIQRAKECALIAVDEIIKECWDHREIDLQAGYDYWVSVKQEIEKL